MVRKALPCILEYSLKKTVSGSCKLLSASAVSFSLCIFADVHGDRTV